MRNAQRVTATTSTTMRCGGLQEWRSSRHFVRRLLHLAEPDGGVPGAMRG